MNYSETYFKLDSKEATNCDHCHLICCVYIKGHISIQYKWSKCVCVEGVKRSFNSLNSFNCYSCYSSRKSWKWCLWLLRNTAYRVLLLNLLLCQKGQKCQILCIQGLSSLPGGKAIWAFHLGGLAVHHQSVWGGSFVKFLGLVNYKGDYRQDTQPIPNS